MKTNLLAASAGLGAIWLVLLFIFCFLAVHTLRVLKRGLEKDVTPVQTPPTEQPKQKESKPNTEKPPETVYYIVEKKKKRPKSSYSEPKEIKFR